MLQFVVSIVILGMIAGYAGRVLVPGPDPMSFPQTVVLGIVGSFVGGTLGYLILDRDLDEGLVQPAGILGSIAGSAVALLIYNWISRRRITQR